MLKTSLIHLNTANATIKLQYFGAGVIQWEIWVGENETPIKAMIHRDRLLRPDQIDQFTYDLYRILNGNANMEPQLVADWSAVATRNGQNWNDFQLLRSSVLRIVYR